MDEKRKAEHKLKVEPVGDTEILMRRQFRAPREMVFRCFTDPKLLTQWLGCSMGKTLLCEVDTSIGGVWRHTMDMGEHGKFETFGQTLEYEAPKRLVRSYVYNVPTIRESVSSETATFSEANGITTVEILIRHLGKESRDGHMGSGLEFGAGSSYDSLEQFLISNKGGA